MTTHAAKRGNPGGRNQYSASPHSLTDRQTEVLRAIWDHMTEYGEYPSYRELMAVLGIRSPNGLVSLLLPLHKKGYLTGMDRLETGGGRGGVKTRVLRLVGARLRPVISDDEAGRRLAAEVGDGRR